MFPVSGFIVESLSRVQLCDPMDCSPPGFPVLHYLLLFAPIHVHWVGDAIQPSYLLLPASPFAFDLSQHQSLFQWIGSSHQVAKVLDLQPQHQSFQWIFRVDFFWGWLVWSPCSPKGSQESSPQHHSSKASILLCSAFFMVQLSHVYMVTEKSCLALNICTLIGKEISLLFNMLYRFLIVFLPRSKPSFNFMAAVTVRSDFGTQENKICHCFHFFPFCLL